MVALEEKVSKNVGKVTIFIALIQPIIDIGQHSVSLLSFGGLLRNSGSKSKMPRGVNPHFCQFIVILIVAPTFNS